MLKLLAFALALPLLACSVGPDGAPIGDGPDGGGDDLDAAPGNVTTVAGTITQSATWSGTIDVTGSTTIMAGATITVSAGTTIKLAVGTTILVRGTLAVEGTSAGKVTIKPAQAGGFHGGFAADSGGRLTFSYVVLTGGGVHLSTGGTAIIVDSKMAHASGDLLTMDGGTVDMQYSQIGVDPGQSDTTHCDMHFDGTSTIRVTHSNITTSAYGVMFYGGTGAVFTSDNWYANSSFSVYTVPAGPGQPGVTGDFTGSWFDNDKVFKAAGTTLTGVVLNPALPRNPAGPRG